MAILKNGIFGEINGRIGNTVHYMLRGKPVIRMVGRKVKPLTSKQLGNLQGMKVVAEFLKPLAWLINIGFGIEAERKGIYPQNAAVSYNKRHALKGVYPNVEMDYAKVLLSKGELQGLQDVMVQLEGNEVEGFALRFNWTLLPEDLDWPRCTDQVMLLAYAHPEESLEEAREAMAHFNLLAATRDKGEAVLKLPSSFIGCRRQLYITVVSADRKKIADSQYLGYSIETGGASD